MSNNYVKRASFVDSYRKINENFHFDDSNNIYREGNKYDVFISYNINDIDVAKALYHFLRERYGFKVYADFIDPSLDRKDVSKRSAIILSNRINSCKILIYIHSNNSAKSKWCPWEIGLASGLKNFNCLVLPLIEDDDNEFVRQEYLTLYPWLTINPSLNGDNKTKYLWVHEDNVKESKNLGKWIKSLGN